MPCYNAALYLEKSVRSLIHQTFTDWELIIVNDGSTDNSEQIAKELSQRDDRIKLISKVNGGYVSARLAGYEQSDKTSKYLLFYDADDMLHPEMVESLYMALECDPNVGAAYCDHRFMNEHDEILNMSADMPRFIPTRFWVKKLADSVKETPFISIFCWTKIIEPMTMIRRNAYSQTPGWDISFGKGQGNIGEGVYLFSEIAITWKVYYINRPLYYYRRHSQQMTSTTHSQMQRQAIKVIDKWRTRLKQGFNDHNKLKPAIIFLNYRLSAYERLGSFKYQLRFKPHQCIRTLILFCFEYLISLRIVFTYSKLVSRD